MCAFFGMLDVQVLPVWLHETSKQRTVSPGQAVCAHLGCGGGRAVSTDSSIPFNLLNVRILEACMHKAPGFY